MAISLRSGGLSERIWRCVHRPAVQRRASDIDHKINQSGETIPAWSPECLFDALGLPSLDRASDESLGDTRNININQQLQHGCSASRRRK